MSKVESECRSMKMNANVQTCMTYGDETIKHGRHKLEPCEHGKITCEVCPVYTPRRLQWLSSTVNEILLVTT